MELEIIDKNINEILDGRKTFLSLISQSMQESARLVRSSLGRSSYVIKREKALAQVAMLQMAKQKHQAIRK